MIYYQSENKLIVFNTNTQKYYITNSEKKVLLNKTEFDSLNPQKIKKQKYCELMNIYFRNNKHQWIYQGKKYRKLDNFNKPFNLTSFYGVKIPRHKIGNYFYLNNLLFVYHWGRVYYMTLSQYFPKEQLIDIKTLKTVRWVDIKNVAPVFNIETKQIV